MGYLRFEDLKKAGKKIGSFADWRSVMIGLAREAENEGRLMQAAFYYRAAEFYTFSTDPDKELLYDLFREFFDLAFKGDRIERYQLPYKRSFLPAIRIPAKGNYRGTIVLHGGFDSFIEEFYSWMSSFSESGYDVVGFEGPGQGAARRKYGLTLDYRWEKPAKAILDYFDLDNVTWLGISMGGYFCFRAAAHESRIKRVIASGIAYDYTRFPNPFFQWLWFFFFRHFKEFTNRASIKKMKKGGVHAWMIDQLMYISGVSTPIQAMEVAMQLNAGNLHADKVKQDVLILTGREDHFIPFKMHRMQVDALNRARSVTERIFTRTDQAQNHCQIGNIGLALDTMLEWIACKS
jgi:pimeloyl-ACP methyl ester carboxylesterase